MIPESSTEWHSWDNQDILIRSFDRLRVSRGNNTWSNLNVNLKLKGRSCWWDVVIMAKWWGINRLGPSSGLSSDWIRKTRTFSRLVLLILSPGDSSVPHMCIGKCSFFYFSGKISHGGEAYHFSPSPIFSYSILQGRGVSKSVVQWLWGPISLTSIPCGCCIELCWVQR